MKDTVLVLRQINRRIDQAPVRAIRAARVQRRLLNNAFSGGMVRQDDRWLVAGLNNGPSPFRGLD